jgi:transcription-repair coupling factor (superfamily II helicase)
LLKTAPVLDHYRDKGNIADIVASISEKDKTRLHLKGLAGSATAMVTAAVFIHKEPLFLVILSDKEEAAYYFNDLENLLLEQDIPFHKKKVLFFPTTYRRPYEVEKTDNNNILSRTEVMKRLSTREGGTIVVSYPEALAEKVVSRSFLKKNTLRMGINESLSIDFVIDLLMEYNFDRVDFVVEPGQFSLRGGIIDVFLLYQRSTLQD